MPNHITTNIAIEATPELIKDLIEKTKLKNNEFDFNAIIPMPKELLDTVSPTTIVETQEEADSINSEYRKRWLDVQEYELHFYWYEESDNDINEYGEPEKYFEAWTERHVDYIGV